MSRAAHWKASHAAEAQRQTASEGAEGTTTATFGFDAARALVGPIIVCDRVWNSGNIGQIIRLAYNMNSEALYFVRDPHRKFSRRKVLARAYQAATQEASEQPS